MKWKNSRRVKVARQRCQMRLAGVEEQEIEKRAPMPGPPVNRKIRAALATGSQIARDLTRKRRVLADRETVQARKYTCKSCEHNKRGSCQKCGCLIAGKIRLAMSLCPIGKWNPGSVSVLIPARNEKYLDRTVYDLLTRAAGPVDIWIFADSWTDYRPVLNRVLANPDNRINITINDGPPVGIRRACNHLARIATGQYIYRVDAHCRFSNAWDIALKDSAADLTVVVPAMRTLDPETWTTKAPSANNYYITPAYKYDTLKDQAAGDSVKEIMCFIGAAWFCKKSTWSALGGYDEKFYHWGESGVEWSLKTWFAGGRLVSDSRSWFAHWFRGRFPYKISGAKIAMNREEIRNHFQAYTGPRSMEWLVNKFKPLPGWHNTKKT